MAGKKAKTKKTSSVSKAIAPVSQTDSTSNKVPIKKKKKNDPLRQQPAWLFPADDENPILNPKNKSPEEIKKEIEDRLNAIKFLHHRSRTAPVKTAPPSELLQLIGAFLASYGFVSTGRIFTSERKARRKLDGWDDEVGEKKLQKSMPDLVKIFKDWRADWEGESDDESTSSDEDSEEDVQMGNADSDSSSSESDGDSDEEDKARKVKQPTLQANGVKIRSKLTKTETESVKKQDEPAISESSSDSDSGSSSDEAEEEAPTSTRSGKQSSSSSDTSSDSESEEEDKPIINKSLTNKPPVKVESATRLETRAKSLINEITKTILPSSLIGKAGSDSSETLKGNSPSKDVSSSVSSSEGSDSSTSESSSSESDSDSDSLTEATSIPKPTITTTITTATATINPSKRKASPAAAESETTSNEPTEAAVPSTESTSHNKRTKISNEPFSRIPKDTKVDPRLASNKYVPYDYAQRAHQDLIVTKGKGFTKEKNKKKRGSYRGGKIDLEGGKAVKFDD